MSAKMKFSDFDKTVRPEHLHGKPVSLEISRVTVEKFTNEKGKTDEKPVLYFHGTPKSLPLNNTNRRLLMRLSDDDPDKCVGMVIIVEPATVKAFGKDVDIVKIKGRDAEAEKRMEARRKKMLSEKPERTAQVTRLINLRMEAEKLGSESEILDPDSMSDADLDKAIAAAAEYITQHQPSDD